MIQTPYGIRSAFTPGRPQPPERDEAYKAWIRRQPSIVSGRYGCDPCHTGPHGTSQKSSDLSCIPLTRKEHQEFDKCQWRYAEKHGFDVAVEVARLNAEYRAKKERAA